MKKIFSLVLLLSIFSCNKKTFPDGAVPVKNFDVNKYLGTWYEIARLDMRFEKNLIKVTANYSLNADGTIKVRNSGYDTTSAEQKEAIGKAKFVNAKDEAKLKVSFFGPFYAGYNVVALDNDYKYALVAGESLKYLWILSREKSIPDSIKNNYLSIAKNIGYNTDELIWVIQ